MIKELVLKYNNVAFLCNSNQEFIDFVDCATKEINFSKGGVEEDKEYILRNYLYAKYAKNTGKLFALICYEDMSRFNELYDKNLGYEFQFYIRNMNNYLNRYHNDGYDWDKYKIIEASKFLRKEKLKKLESL